MPYIPLTDRHNLAKKSLALTPGELNYEICSLILSYLGSRQPVSYGVYNEAIGALECAKQEIYRRAVVPYEKEKQALHGDVF